MAKLDDLCLAINNNDVKTVTDFINDSNISDIFTQNESAVEALLQSFKKGHLDVISLLLDANAFDIKKDPKFFLYACSSGNTELVKLLLKIHPDIIIHDDYFMTAIENNHVNIFECLLTKKWPNILTKIIEAICKSDNVDMFKKMAHYGLQIIPDPNQKWPPKPLAYITFSTQLTYGRFLQFICKHNSVKLLDVLMQYKPKPNINLPLLILGSALHIAYYYGYINLFEQLLEYNANINVTNCCRKTVLYLACEEYQIDIINRLLSVDTSNINTILSKAQDTVLIACLNKRPPSLSDKSANLLRIVEQLIIHGADCNLAEKIHGNSPLIVAVMQGHPGVVINHLLQSGANVNHQNNSGETSLMIAVKQKNTELIKLFLKHPSIDLTIENNSRETAIDLVAGSSPEIKKLFKPLSKSIRILSL